MDVRATQRATLEKFLDTGVKGGVPWRVLVVDDVGEHIVSTLMTAGALREHHVTMTVRVADERAEHGTAQALYIVAPTVDNARAVVRDVDGAGSGRRARPRRYAGASVAFTSRASKEVLEVLAQCRLPARIHAVVDLYSDFVCPESNLFALRADAGVSYTALQARVKAAVNAAADALHCVVASLGAVPIIRAERGGAAEAVARALNARLAADLGRFRRPSSFRRPLLLLLDRDHDFAPVLHHSWAYQALVHDCLQLSRNEVVFSTRVDAAPDAAPKRKTLRHRLDKVDDEFWRNNSQLPFPQVAEAIEEALTQYRAEVEAINRRAGRAANGLPDDADDETGTGGNLAQAMQSLPELTRRKERLDIHTNIGTALVEAIDQRKLDVYYEFETGVLDEAVRAGSGLLRAHAELHLHALRQLLSSGAGTVADRTRAACLFYGAMGGVMDPELVSELKDAMLDGGVAPDILQCVRVARGFDHRKVEEVEPAKEVRDDSVWTRPSLRGMMKHVVKKGYSGITAVAQVATTMMTAKAASFRTTRTALLFVDATARERAPEDEVAAALEGFIYLDPKVADELDDADANPDAEEEDAVRRDARKRRCGAIYEDAVVFVCGGGSYVEMASILEGAQQADGAPRVLYGCTQLLKGDELVEELRKSLGGDETSE